MKKSFLLKTMLLLFALIAGVGSTWAADVTGTITFGSASSSTNVNAASVTGDDSQGNTWTVTTVGTTSFTPNSNYAQIGASKSPATSITFTTTLSNDVTITAFSAKFGGFNGTAGTVTLKVGETTVGTGSLNATNDVTVSSTSSVTGKVLTVTVTGISKGVKAYYISYTYSKGPAKTPIATIDATLPASLNYGATGTFIADITSAEGTTADDYEVTWSSNDQNKLSVENTGAYTAGTTKGEVTVTVNVEPVDDATYSSVSKEFTINIVDPNANDGSAEKPFTVAEARDYIDDLNGSTSAEVYVKGIISKVDSYNSNYSSITYWISDDGTTDTQLEVYSGKGIDGADFASKDDLQVGDEVVVKGNLKLYDTTYEFDKNNQLVSLVRKQDCGLAWSAEEVTIEQNATDYTLPTLTNPSNLTVTYSSDNEEIATIDESTGEVSVNTSAEGTATITAAFAGNDDFKPANVSYKIVVLKAGLTTYIDLRDVTTSLTFSPGSFTASGQGYKSYDNVTFTGSDSKEYSGWSLVDVMHSGENMQMKKESGKVTMPEIKSDAGFTIEVTAVTNNVTVSDGTNSGTNKLTVTSPSATITISAGSAYAVISSIKITPTIPENVTATIASSGYTTYCSPYDLSFEGVENLEAAYVVTTSTSSSAKLTKVTAAPAGTGVILKGTTGAVSIPVAEYTGEAISNILVGTLTATHVDTETVYVVSDGKFKLFAGTEIPANKAYLPASALTGGAPSLSFDFGGETTGINSVERGELSVEGCYTLDGRRVAQPTKGMYIVNGRKVIIK